MDTNDIAMLKLKLTEAQHRIVELEGRLLRRDEALIDELPGRASE